ncbi:MAG: glycosyltransferase family 4 protein [Actinomycetota bacterium]|nr:glycosyltransferase family 4 protein [Actinomycetota bacterium]
MRILVVTNDFPPRVGGINHYVAELMRQFPGGDVTIFAADWRGASAHDASYPHPVVRWPGRSIYPTTTIRERIEGLVATERPDIVLFGAALPLARLGKGILRRFGVPYAAFTHGVEIWAGQLPGTRRILTSIARHASLLFGPSQWTIDALRQVVGDEPRIELLPPGVDVHRFNPLVSDREVRERHHLGDGPVISCVARLTLRKGQDKVIRAMPWILREVPEARFLVVGGGPDLERLQGLAMRKRVADRVIFAGEVSSDVLPAYLRAGDVFAMPCRTRKWGLEVEGFGLAFLEAAAVGRPAVAGHSGGAPEAVVHGRTGLVVDGAEVDEVAEAVLALLQDPSGAAELGRAGAARVRSEFTWASLASRLRTLLAAAVTERAA